MLLLCILVKNPIDENESCFSIFILEFYVT